MQQKQWMPAKCGHHNYSFRSCKIFQNYPAVQIISQVSELASKIAFVANTQSCLKKLSIPISLVIWKWEGVLQRMPSFALLAYCTLPSILIALQINPVVEQPLSDSRAGDTLDQLAPRQMSAVAQWLDGIVIPKLWSFITKDCHLLSSLSSFLSKLFSVQYMKWAKLVLLRKVTVQKTQTKRKTQGPIGNSGWRAVVSDGYSEAIKWGRAHRTQTSTHPFSQSPGYAGSASSDHFWKIVQSKCTLLICYPLRGPHTGFRMIRCPGGEKW